MSLAVTPLEEEFSLSLEGFSGPLDVLLAAVRHKKIDLHTLSVRSVTEALAEYMQQNRAPLDVLSGYTVAAAWLVYLKSRFLLPADPDDDNANETAPADAAKRLADHLRLLESLREAAEKLAALPRLGRDFFARGSREPVEANVTVRYRSTLYALMQAYGTQSKRIAAAPLRVGVRERDLVTPAQARRRLAELLPGINTWTPRRALMPHIEHEEPQVRRSAAAACLTVCLETTRDGDLEVREHPQTPHGDFEARRVTARSLPEITAYR